MTIQEIKGLIEALQASDITHFSYQKDGLKLKIEKAGIQNQFSTPAVGPVWTLEQSNETDAATNQAVNAAQPQIVEAVEPQSGSWVASPLVGVFYGSPSPSSPSFVKVGDYVKKGDVLCIIEAMKVMNEITAEADGKVLEIAAVNESLVEFGQKLILIG